MIPVPKRLSKDRILVGSGWVRGAVKEGYRSVSRMWLPRQALWVLKTLYDPRPMSCALQTHVKLFLFLTCS